MPRVGLSRLSSVGISRLAWVVLPRRAKKASHCGVDAVALAAAFGGGLVCGKRTDCCALRPNMGSMEGTGLLTL